MKYIVSLSGGNNSLNCLHYCLNKFKHENIIAIFADNHFEHPSLYEGLDGIEKTFGINIIRVESDKYLNPVDINKRRCLIGHDKVRCTEELKIIPIKKGIKNNFSDINEYCMVLGFNKDETKRMERARKFQEKAKEHILFFPAEQEDGHPISYVDGRDIFNYPKQGVYEHNGRSNNCGGGCFKMSTQGGYILWKSDPNTFLKGEEYEQEIHNSICFKRDMKYGEIGRTTFATKECHLGLDHKKSLRDKRLEGEKGIVPRFKKRSDGSVYGKCQQAGIECGFTV